MKTYAEKLKDPRWQRKRLEVMQRDKFSCRGCRDTKNALNVHHCYYLPRAAPWDYPDKSLVTLCEDCHSELTYRLTTLLDMIKTPFDACSAIELLRLLGGSERRAFKLAMGLGFAMELVESAAADNDRRTAALMLDHTVESLNVIKEALLK